MSLLSSGIAYKPFHYPWAYEAWQVQQQIHWIPEEVPMTDDVRDWKEKMTESEKNLCTQVFRFFTQADIEVNDCYMTKYSQVFKPTEVKMMLASFANMETIHIAGYSYLIETLGMPNTIYEEFLKYKEMKDKYDYMHKFGTDTKEGIAKTLAVFGGFTEGVQLFSTFAILLNFPRHNKMKGMGQIITWSARDETLHTNSIIKLFKTFIQENPEIWTEELKSDIYEACATIVHFEDAFIELAFNLSTEIEGLKSVDLKRYIRYIADYRLIQLGLKPIYLIEKNPLPWMDEMLNGVEHANFFESRVTEYSKGATKGTWDDVFSLEEDSKEEKKVEESWNQIFSSQSNLIL
jgi:ribonucleoside-diphosphate reductase beta chain